MDTSQQKKLAIAVVLLLVAFAFLLFRGCGAGEMQVNRDFYRSAAKRSADAISGALPSDSRVALISLPIEASPPYEVFCTQLEESLGKGGINVVAHEKVAASDPDALVGMLDSGSFPAGDLQDLVGRHPGLSAVISLAGAPAMSDRELEDLTGAGTKLIICSLSRQVARLPHLIEQGLVSMAIRPAAKATTSTAFEDRFEIRSSSR